MLNAQETPYSHDLDWPRHLRPFDPWDPAIQADPYPHYAWMREHAPVLRTQTKAGDAWYLSRFRDVQCAFRTPKLFSSQRPDPKLCPHIIVMDDPDHTRMRAVVAHAFNPKAVLKVEDRIRSLAERYFKPILDSGGGEIVGNFGVPLTMGTIASLLGMPLEETERFRKWTDDFSSFLGRVAGMAAGYPGDEAGAMAFIAHMRRAMDDAPVDGNSLLSCIARALREGQMNEDEASYFGPLLFNAGYETTTTLIANGVVLLAEMPHLLTRLREQPADIPKFIEELLRFKSSVHRMRRLTTQEVDIAGTIIPARASVFLLMASANRDSEKFPNSETFDMDRDTSAHISFGFGVHSCLGSWLARMELKAAFELIARTVSKIEFNPSADLAVIPVTGGNGGITGAKSVTVKLTLS